MGWGSQRAPGMRIGKFQVLAKLGTGAHSTILHIRRTADSRQYALKVVPAEGPEDAKYVAQARHEFEVAQRLSHSALVKIYALETQRDWLFRVRKMHLLSEYVNGPTLDTIKVLAVPKLAQLFERVAAGLSHMHRRGVYHGDLKPNNIILSKVGDVKVIDYGLAWIKGQDKGRVQGTPEYMAPETAGQGVVNERTDIYNLGATMYRMVTWRMPPSAVPQPGSLPPSARTWDRHFKPVRECNALAPAELGDLIHHCLAFDPRKRPERMAEVHEVLEQLVEKVVQTPEDRLEALEW